MQATDNIFHQLSKQSSTYIHPYVKALSWIVYSPPLLAGTNGSSFQLLDIELWDSLCEDIPDFLVELDRQPQQLIDWVDKVRSYRLGLRYETLLHFLLKHFQEQGKISNLHSNVVLFDEAHRTLGEMDFIFYHPKTQQRFHWETAIKYYLFRPQEFSFERWTGANGGDWLSRKVEHMFSRQLGISNTLEARNSFKKYFDEAQNEMPLIRQALLKGVLFYPLGDTHNLNLDEQDLLSTAHAKGWWCNPDNFYKVDPDQTGKWKIIEKLNWIVPQSCQYMDESIYTGQEMNILIKNHFKRTKRSLMLVHLYLDEESQLWSERSRGIIVDKLWPTYKKS